MNSFIVSLNDYYSNYLTPVIYKEYSSGRYTLFLDYIMTLVEKERKAKDINERIRRGDTVKKVIIKKI